MKANSFQNYLERLYSNHAGIDAGAVASYIPKLLKADPAGFGIVLITVDGHVYQVGDSHQPFTIQSISKAITYGLALEDQGIEAVLSKVDVEPSGEAFNSISLEPGTGRPSNPMINAGAIATLGLVEGGTPELKFSRMLQCYEKYLGRSIVTDEDVYRSEKSTGHRNRAIAYLLHNSNIIEKDPRRRTRCVFQAMLSACHLQRPGSYRSDTREQRGQSDNRNSRFTKSLRTQRTKRDEFLWYVRLFRRLDLRNR